MNGESCGTNWRQHGTFVGYHFNIDGPGTQIHDDNCTEVLAKINTMRTNPEDFL